MPIYIGDYLRDTMGLTAQEHGCYLLLLLRCWTDKQLPNDVTELLATTRLENSKILEKILNRYFYRAGDSWRNKRVDRELARRDCLSAIGRKGGQVKSERKTRAVRENARKGGRPKNLSENLTETKAPQSQSQSQSESHSEEERHRHGINKHVLLSDTNYSELCERYGKELADEYIQKVDDYCANHGKTYANYVNAVHTYIRNDVKRGKLKLETPIKDKECPQPDCDGLIWGGVCNKCGWSKSRPGKIE